ncbi:MAG: PspC domain-containing protein [Bacteroidales bacterium]
MEPRKLYRSQTDSVIAGVCGGLAEYFDIDPVLVRVIFVLLLIFGGGGFLVYVILWIVTPKKPLIFDHSGFSTYQKENTGPSAEDIQDSTNETMSDPKVYKYRGSLIGGMILLTLGVLFLMDELIPYLDFGKLWPVILIVVGIILIANTISRNKK